MKRKVLLAAAIVMTALLAPVGVGTLQNTLSVSASATNNNTASGNDITQPEETPAPPQEDIVISEAIDATENILNSDTLTSEQKVEALQNMDFDVLTVAMNVEPEIVAGIESLEEELGIAATMDISEEAATILGTGTTKVVGAGLSGASSLKVDTVEESAIAVSETLGNIGGLDVDVKTAVCLDLKLLDASNQQVEAAVPVAITIPVPVGMNGSKAWVFHYSDDGNTLLEILNTTFADGCLTFIARGFSPYVLAEADIVLTPDEDNDSQECSPSQNWAATVGNVTGRILAAKDGDTVTITKDQGVTALSNEAMKALLKKNVTLVMEYTYKDKDYRIVIPAGAAEDNDIAWYGPLYLAGKYASDATVAQGTYTVQKGDSLSKIAKKHGMTLNELLKLNPSVVGKKYIYPGQKLVVK